MVTLMRWCQVAVDTLWLGILMTLVSVTVVGLPAALVAGVATANAVQAGRQPGIAKQFFQALRDHGRMATVVGVPWMVVGIALALNLHVTQHMGDERLVVLVVLALLALLYAALCGVLPCVVMARGDHGGWALTKLAILVVAARPGMAGQVVLVLAALAVGAYAMPPVLLAAGGVVAHILCFFWRFRVGPLLAGEQPPSRTGVSAAT